MANYKRKRRAPLRACAMFKYYKYMGNGRERRTGKENRNRAVAREEIARGAPA